MNSRHFGVFGMRKIPGSLNYTKLSINKKTPSRGVFVRYVILLFMVAVSATLIVLSNQRINVQNRQLPNNITKVAAGTEIPLNFALADNWGTVDNELGVDVTQYYVAGNTSINQVIGAAQGGFHISEETPEDRFIIRLVNPNVSVLDDDTLFANYRSYFTFTDNTNVESFADSYYAKYSNQAIFDLQNVDVGLIDRLKNKHPEITIHGGNLNLWPREAVKSIFAAAQPPKLQAVSFKLIRQATSDMFSEIKLMFDTLYDATGDIAGSSGVYINYPPNALLSVSEISSSNSTPEERSSFLTGIISGGIVAAVQRQSEAGKAPSKFLITPLTYENNTLLAYIGQFMLLNPTLAWPWAIPQNGNPYDNTFYPEKNAKPFVGVIGKIPEGFYIILTNASPNLNTAVLPSELNVASYEYYTTYPSGTIAVNANKIDFHPYETIIMAPTFNQTTPPESTPTETPTPGGVDPTATPSASLTPTRTLTPSTVSPTTPSVTRSSPPITATQTATPTQSPSPSLTRSPTPSPTIRATPTSGVAQNAPSPTPIVAPFCDTRCGVCGWRDVQGLCHTAGGLGESSDLCCYHGCIGTTCKVISGVGSDTCTSNAMCGGADPTGFAPTLLPYTGIGTSPTQPYVLTPSTQPTITLLASITNAPTPTPPISGISQWQLLLLVPLIVIVGGLVL